MRQQSNRLLTFGLLIILALAVIVEYGGSGGRVAGPIANQIIHALQDEGYLPGEAFARGGWGR